VIRQELLLSILFGCRHSMMANSSHEIKQWFFLAVGLKNIQSIAFQAIATINT
jgi:hypothetical protein